MTRPRQAAAMRGPTLPIRLLGLIWFISTAAALGLAAQSILDRDPAQSSTLVLLLPLVTALLFAIGLLRGRPWARALAVLLHLELGLVMLLLLWNEWPYESLARWLPAWLTAESWSGVIALLGLIVVAIAVALSYWFGQAHTWAYFAGERAPLLTQSCPRCGASWKESQYCPYCDQPAKAHHLLWPLLTGAPPVTVPFELGHWRVAVGRDVSFLEARLQHPGYKNIGRNHATLEYDPRKAAVTIAPYDFHHDVYINGQPVNMASPVHVGDIVRLNNVDFVFGSQGEIPLLATFSSVEDPSFVRLLSLTSTRTERRLGRAPDNDVVLPWTAISRHHIRVFTKFSERRFYLQNLSSHPDSAFVEDEPVEPQKIMELSSANRTLITLDRRDFFFHPIPFDASGRVTL